MSYQMRPRFKIKLDLSVQGAMERVTQQLKNPDCPCEGKLSKKHAMLYISKGARRFWSPFVSLEFDENTEQTEINGVIGPSPNMWMMFTSGYALLAFFAFVMTMLGISQIIIKQTPWGFYCLPGILLLAVFWYSLSFMGQRLATGQIHNLRKLLDCSFGDRVIETSERTNILSKGDEQDATPAMDP